jgi:hypothetical protein
MSYASNNDKKTYTLFINSINKISGPNNNAVYNIVWDSFLPRKFNEYKIVFNFQSLGGFYFDKANGISNTSARILCDFQSKSFTYDTNNGSSGSTNLGIISRDLQTSTTSSNTFSSFYYQNCSRCIGRPMSNILSIQIFNNYTNALLLNTLSDGTPLTDMTPYTLMIEFIPLENSEKNNL